jgi:ABC-type glycerol-3-phosphate transport system substrate-binding protein
MPSLLRFTSIGIATAAITWAVLAFGHALSAKRATHQVIKTAMNSDGIGGGHEISWDTMEVKQFEDYARKQGWDDTELVVVRFVGDDDTTKYIASQIAGESPDVIIASDSQITFFDDHNLIEPLDPYLEKWSDYREGKFNEEMLNACRGRDGKILGIPVAENSPAVFAIRQDWLDNLGLEVPETFAEAREIWRSFTFDDPDGNGKDDTYGYGLTMMTKGGAHLRNLMAFMHAVRVAWYELNEQGQFVPTFNTPDAAFVLNFVKSCYEEGLFGKDVMFRIDSRATRRFFVEADVGMTGPNFADWFPNLASRYGLSGKTRYIPFLWQDEEARSRDKYGTFTYLTRLRCLMRASPDKDLGWRYMEYFFSREWMNKYISRRGLPFVRGRYLGQFGTFKNEIPWKSVRNDVAPEIPMDEEVVAQIKPLEKYVIRTPMMTEWPKAANAITEIFVDFYLGRYPTAEDALTEAEDRFLEIVEGSVRPDEGFADSNSGKGHHEL